MKLLKVFAAVLVAAVALSSCYWTGNLGQGGLTIDVSQIQPKQAGDVVRVYLLADGKLFSTGGGVPFSAQVVIAPYPDETKVSIQGLPVGPQYQALIGVGPANSGIFTPHSYGKSGLFQVSPGTDTTVLISLYGINSFNGITFSSELMEKNLKGVVDAGGFNAYTAEDSKLYLTFYDSYTYPNVLYVSDSYDLAADPDIEGVSAFRVNGLSDDGANLASDAFISSPNGVLPFYGGDGWGFQPTFSIDLEGDKNILESADFLAGADYAFFFRRAGGLGGTYVDQPDKNIYGNWSWVNLDVPGVLDLTVSANNAYFATESGAFALPPAFLSDPSLAAYKMPFLAPAPIMSLDFLPTGGLPGGTLFMGTTNGVYMGTVTEITSPPSISLSAVTQIPETAGQKIEHIAISKYYSNSNQAFLSNYWLYIRKSLTETYEIPFFAVLPGKPTGMSWDSSGVLYISGTEGLSAVYVGS